MGGCVEGWESESMCVVYRRGAGNEGETDVRVWGYRGAWVCGHRPRSVRVSAGGWGWSVQLWRSAGPW